MASFFSQKNTISATFSRVIAYFFLKYLYKKNKIMIDVKKGEIKEYERKLLKEFF